MPTSPEPLVWTPAEVAKLLRCSVRYVYMLVEEGELPAMRLGRKVLIPRAGLDRRLAELIAASPKATAQAAS